ncbi:MAG: glycosyltransferase family 4 protein [Hyphomonadaceae bacterium]|jgi:glycosyltransferase involved in cell wall biosynthesis|nr:glycosyltransferase family 4 protein [Hyphomonadaceae bacterium]
MARAAREAGFEVHVLTKIVNHRADIEGEGFIIHPLSWGRGSVSPLAAAVAVAKINAALRRIAPSVVHNVAVKPAILGSLACLPLRRLGVVNSITGLGSAFLQSSLKARLVRSTLRMLFRLLFNRRFTLNIVQNPDDRAALRSAGVCDGRIVLIPGSGVDTEVLQPLPESPPPIKVAFVGRMLEDKGVRTLIEAHRHLRREGSDVELLLAGTADPENPTSIADEEVNRWACERGVTWLGHVTDIRGVWARSHIAVLPSRREGLPKSLLEAAACARPLVATDAPGCREIARHGETGLLVPVDAPLPLAEAIATLARDPTMRQRMGVAARALVVKRFSAADIGKQVVGVYRRLLSETQHLP